MKNILEALRKAREESKKRKFTQTWDLILALKNIDLKKPENRINLEFSLPEGRGKDVKVLFIADTLLEDAKKHAHLVISKNELEKIGKNKKLIKKYASQYDWLFAEAPLMPLVGKLFGTVLGPRGKMPKPVSPKAKVEPFIESAKKLVRIRVKDSPVIHIPVGTEDMEDEKVAKNIEAVYNFIKERLPKGVANIKNVYIKLTMGKPVKLEM
ncbi:MAG TPA: 50S ribosomal protein L1 [Candidatus Aenigmarchaeota archaeon]|nr:MAG: 50S ribosomal protein L1 [Candidatus Aenigmarchaeota archaeon]HDD46482.1 50S ribosomal protein L1 [Candidatus Aenigmarchaeota archaeon]